MSRLRADSIIYTPIRWHRRKQLLSTAWTQAIDQRLLEHFQAELARYSENKLAVPADSFAIQSQVTATIALAMEIGVCSLCVAKPAQS